jgi:hypothetical protein
MEGSHKIKSILLLIAMMSSTNALAADDVVSSKLNNLSKTKDSEGYYLVQDKVWSEYDCITDSGNKKINPNETSVLKVKKECKWAGIRYKIFKVTNNEDMGFLAHSYRDGTFSIEVTSPCNGDECNFYDLSPEQTRKKTQ